MAARTLALAAAALSLGLGARAGLDLTAGNRRSKIDGLPDWSTAGYGSGQALSLPGDSEVGYTLSAQDLADKFGVKADDGQDDSDGLYAAITAMKTQGRKVRTFAVIQLPPGKIQLSKTLHLDANYVILRGAGNDPANGGTTLEFRPDKNTEYDVLTADGSRWDQDHSGDTWDIMVDDGKGGVKPSSGEASGGWIWPGRSMIHIGSTKVAPKWEAPYEAAPANRKDLYLGSINFHFRNNTHTPGFMADQTKDIAGKMGDDKVYYDAQNTSWSWNAGQDMWIGVPVRKADYDAWGVKNESLKTNQYMYQDWFTIKSAGSDAQGSFLQLDHPLRFDVFSSSVSGGSEQMQNETIEAKVMPIEDAVHHVGIENLYLTQPLDGTDVSQAKDNYGNISPADAMHGMVFRFARDSWVRNVHTFMTGSHPIATENARYLQIQDNFFEGAWNKGSGGNGYVRGSRVWDSVYYNNTLRGLRHITFQWCAMGNVAIRNDMDNDMNLHGGYEGYNLFEGNTVKISYAHRSGSCAENCGGEGGAAEEGTWGPIYWSAGDKAAKWSGASGPQNVFFNNVMQKAWTEGGSIDDYTPYYKSDGSLQNTIFEFGWSDSGYKGLSTDGQSPISDWLGNEQKTFAAGVVSSKTDSAKSLFVKDVDAQAATTPKGAASRSFAGVSLFVAVASIAAALFA
ncbi:hypothetical protein BKA62DRAFT_709079 [Auriculariales sp. MPI-PUGE-AT-0066]|nr:hypothetical protein BKA62DRAFT_709079 [Auriculariales sp. MPI-PUGE-AT-0066]